MTKFFIPKNVPSSKNSRVWTGRFFVASKATQKWRKETSEFWKKQKEEFLETIKNLKFPITVYFTFIRGTKHEFDYVNPLQTVLDEMVHNGWLEDDNANIILPVFKPYEYDKKNPGVIIEV